MASLSQATISKLALSVAALFGSVSAVSAEPVNLRLATTGVGSGWYNYGAGMAELVLTALPEGSTIDVLPIAGGEGNIKLLQAGETEMGISFPMPAADACQGTGAYDKVQDKIRGMVGGLDVFYFSTFVRKDAGISSWQDIVDGKVKLATANIGGTGEQGVRQVLSLLGATKDSVSDAGGSVKALKRTATQAAIGDGQMDAWAHIVSKGHPVATQMTSTIDMTILPLPPEVRSGMASKFGWIEAEIPAGLFKGQDAAVPTVKAASNIMVSADVDEEIVYTFVKTIVDKSAELRKVHAALGDFNPKMAGDKALLGGCPLHPGAERAYREAGILQD